MQGVKKRSMSKDLIIEEVRYSDQGEYVCEAVNVIGGERRVVRSGVVRLEVEGVPLVTRMLNEVYSINFLNLIVQFNLYFNLKIIITTRKTNIFSSL